MWLEHMVPHHEVVVTSRSKRCLEQTADLSDEQAGRMSKELHHTQHVFFQPWSLLALFRVCVHKDASLVNAYVLVVTADMVAFNFFVSSCMILIELTSTASTPAYSFGSSKYSSACCLRVGCTMYLHVFMPVKVCVLQDQQIMSSTAQTPLIFFLSPVSETNFQPQSDEV